MALTTLDIKLMIEPFQQNGIFKGVFPCDGLPEKFSLPAGFVINLSDHNSRGSHWVGLFIDRKRTADYFDSFGFPPKQREIIRFIKKHSKRLNHNKKQIQHIISNKCGKFVILFILCKIFNKSVNQVIDKFSSNMSVNDILIENLYAYFTQLRKSIIYNQ